MKAMVLNKLAPVSANSLVLSDLPDPIPGPKQLLVRVHCCGVCRTDLHVIEGELPSKRLPLIPGHQIVGRIVKTGLECSRFSIGARIGVAWLGQTCGECVYCARGAENLCPDSLYTGYHQDGGYAEYCLVNEDFAYLIPEEFKDEEAAPLLCAGIIGYRALKRSNLKPGERLALYGFGSSAHITIQIALSWGCEVLVISRDAKHRKLAEKLGASWAGASNDSLPKKANSAIVFAPAGELVPLALRNLYKGGTVALAGIYMTPVPQMEYEECLFHEKDLRSVESNTRADGCELLTEARKIGIKPEVSLFPLEAANKVLSLLKGDQISGTAVLKVAE